MSSGELNELLQVLHGLISPDNLHRTQSEEHLKNLQKREGIGVLLIKISLETSFPVYIRQLASLTLKKYVKEHWLEGEDSFVGPQASENDKLQIKQLLPSTLSDPESKIRTAGAMAIASIAHWDWPNAWPNLIENLLGCLEANTPSMGNPFLLKGALCCLDMFADGENLSDEHLPYLLKLLIPAMFKIFSDASYTDTLRMRAISVLHSLIKWLAIIKNQYKQHIASFFQTVFPSWYSSFRLILEQPDNPQQNCGLKVSVVKVLILLSFEFPKYMKQFIPELVERMWSSIVHNLDFFLKIYVHEELQISPISTDPDEEVEGLEELILELWEFLAVLLDKKELSSILRTQLAAVFFIGLAYMQITHDQEESWLTDANQFIIDEEDAFNSYNVRSLINNFFDGMIDKFEGEAAKAFSLAISRRIEDVNNIKLQNGRWTKLKEAMIAAVSGSAGSLLELEEFDIVSFVNNVLLPEIQNQSDPFLKGSALVCAGRFASKIPTESALPFLITSAQSLQSPQDSAAVKIGACKAISSFCPGLEKDVIKPFLSSILTGTTALIPTATEDSLHLVLETLNQAIKVNDEITAQHHHIIVPYLLSVWTKNANDPLIMELAESVLASFIKNPLCGIQVGEIILPPIVTFLKDSHEIPGLTSGSIVFLTTLINSLKEVPDNLVVQTFPLLLQKLFNTQDSELLQCGTLCLIAYLRKVSTKLVQWKPDGQTSGLELMIQFIAKTLSSDEDFASLRIGTLVYKLISLFPDQLGTKSGDLLKAILTKLEANTNPHLLQPLLAVFIRLIHTHSTQVLPFLANLSTTNSGNALHFILSLWTKNHEEFQGDYHIKLSIVTLVELFQLTFKDPTLQSVAVPGELIVNPNEGIKTRSKSKGTNVEQFSSVPLVLKIVQILLKEYQVIEEAKDLAKPPGEDSSGEEGENEEDLDQTESPFVDADFLDFVEDDEEELEDPDVQSDPIFSLDLKEYIRQFFRSFAQSNPVLLNQLGKQVNQLDQQCLLSLITN